MTAEAAEDPSSAPPAPPTAAAFSGLLLDVQRHLESLYGLEPGAPVTDFVIPADGADGLPGVGSRTLVAHNDGEISLAVVFERSIREHLLRADPRARLDAANLGAFSTLTEEVSHFVYLLHSAQREKTVTQLELELQAEVDKYLTATLLIGLQNEGALSSGLRGLLFHSYRLADGVTGERAERYHAANRLADRYCAWLERRFLRAARVEDLAREARRFYRCGQREKLETIAALL